MNALLAILLLVLVNTLAGVRDGTRATARREVSPYS
jgi:hypothetical protein